MNSNVVALKLKSIKKPLKTPKNLKKSGKKLWESVVRSFNLEEHDLVLLHALCECADRKDQAERELSEYGSLTFKRNYRDTYCPVRRRNLTVISQLNTEG
jgi:phage terminase small subunit